MGNKFLKASIAISLSFLVLASVPSIVTTSQTGSSDMPIQAPKLDSLPAAPILERIGEKTEQLREGAKEIRTNSSANEKKVSNIEKMLKDYSSQEKKNSSGSREDTASLSVLEDPPKEHGPFLKGIRERIGRMFRKK